MGRDVVGLLDRRLRLHREARFDPGGPALWVRRTNPVERLLAAWFQKGERRVRLELDAQGARVISRLVDQGPITGHDLAADLGVGSDDAAVARKDPDLAALLVFLSVLQRGGTLIAE